MARNVELEYLAHLQAEIFRTREELKRLESLYALVAERVPAESTKELAKEQAAEDPVVRVRGKRATDQVIGVLEDAGIPLLTSEIQARVPGLAQPTVRSVLFHQNREGEIIKIGTRPFRWALKKWAEKEFLQ